VFYSLLLYFYPVGLFLTQSNQDGHTSNQTNKIGLMKKNPDFTKLWAFFEWLQPDVINKAFENTTQHARIPTGTVLKHAFKSPNPALM
jgi:hypothetical protein